MQTNVFLKCHAGCRPLPGPRRVPQRLAWIPLFSGLCRRLQAAATSSSCPPPQALLVRRVFAVLLVKGQRLFSRLFFVCRPPESEPVCHFEADEEVWGGGVWPGQGRARGRRPGSPGRHRWECVRVTCKRMFAKEHLLSRRTSATAGIKRPVAWAAARLCPQPFPLSRSGLPSRGRARARSSKPVCRPPPPVASAVSRGSPRTTRTSEEPALRLLWKTEVPGCEAALPGRSAPAPLGEKIIEVTSGPNHMA